MSLARAVSRQAFGIRLVLQSRYKAMGDYHWAWRERRATISVLVLYEPTNLEDPERTRQSFFDRYDRVIGLGCVGTVFGPVLCFCAFVRVIGEHPVTLPNGLEKMESALPPSIVLPAMLIGLLLFVARCIANFYLAFRSIPAFVCWLRNRLG